MGDTVVTGGLVVNGGLVVAGGSVVAGGFVTGGLVVAWGPVVTGVTGAVVTGSGVVTALVVKDNNVSDSERLFFHYWYVSLVDSGII